MWWFIIQHLLSVTIYVAVVADEDVLEINIIAFARNDPICAKLNQ